METKSTYINFLFCIVITIYFGCNQTIKDNNNTLLNSWSGNFGGIPAFDQIQVEDVEEAMLYSIASHLEEIQKIAENTDPPTFENTIEAMERSGKQLDRAYAYYGVLSNNKSTEEFRKIEKNLAPNFADYHSKIIQNEKLFKGLMRFINFQNKIHWRLIKKGLSN